MLRGAPWVVFSIFVVIVLGAFGWFANRLVELDQAERRARQADHVASVCNRAMWRMEFSAGSLALQEAARPYYEYVSILDRSRPFGEEMGAPSRAVPIEASPLLGRFVPFTLLHFQLGPDGDLTSPQVPVGWMNDVALKRYQIDAGVIQRAQGRLGALREALKENPLQRRLVSAEEGSRGVGREGVPLTDDRSPQLLKSLTEWRARRDTGESSDERGGVSSRKSTPRAIVGRSYRWLRSLSPPESADPSGGRAQPEASAGEAPKRTGGAGGGKERPAESSVEDGILWPIWAGEKLLLARHVKIDGAPLVQGCWLDWEAIETELLSDIHGLLPNARLVRSHDATPSDDGLTLAALPIRLIPGAVTTDVASSPLRQTLWVALTAVMVAVVAVAVLLKVVLLFSERRANFVSAVTHELRTPLTTLRMYADLLADGRVKGEEKRQRYFETLRKEADRLGLLVENVLTFSRIERTRPLLPPTTMTQGELVDRAIDRCRDRAAAAGMTLDVTGEAAARDHRVRVDLSAFEQVLFNLVDNACKYAATPDRDNNLEVCMRRKEGRRGAITIRDHGPGIPQADRRQLFRPFSRIGRDAASHSGVGLGLSLCRQLMRQMGGDLRIDPTIRDGAAFEIVLKGGEPSRAKE